MTQNYKTTKTTIDNQGNTKPDYQSRRWCGTLNNYSKEEYDNILTYFKKNSKYIIGKEIGEKKTPHLQIYFENKSPIKFKTLKNLNIRIHWEKAKGSINDNYKYCSKENNYETNIIIEEDITEILKQEAMKEYDEIKWYEWQQKILDICETKPNNRTINWIYDNEGNKGKSFLCRYIFLKYNAIICDGKKNDILNQIVQNARKGLRPYIIVLDIPRHSSEFTNYGLIEQIKNGLIYSGKYEGGALAFPSPHIFIFSNSEPIYEKFTKDRWNIITI